MNHTGYKSHFNKVDTNEYETFASTRIFEELFDTKYFTSGFLKFLLKYYFELKSEKLVNFKQC